MSQDSSFSDVKKAAVSHYLVLQLVIRGHCVQLTSPHAGSAPTAGGHTLLTTERALSVVAEIEERSPQTTPTTSIEREESTNSEWEDRDTLPLI